MAQQTQRRRFGKTKPKGAKISTVYPSAIVVIPCKAHVQPWIRGASLADRDDRARHAAHRGLDTRLGLNVVLVYARLDLVPMREAAAKKSAAERSKEDLLLAK